ncbi:hypothetical protein OVS_03675 [Mycoplasma ovis str. Michigan]|uniref:Uncharacterized protein n=1 Tax=Mycoplasma ovis str. Michigan TaxID=1415773 RepID=A0ABM5P1Y1_9MOLU|nr:hypothetical protein [Mycoplasma ovis]AHC40483.1 hypothetical protein OVS_03675 [Mycoplasma ovis str. Michigan]
MLYKNKEIIHSNSTKLTSIVCTNEDGVLEELGIVEGANIDDSLKQLINEELKKDKDKCLTSQDHSFNYY